MLRGKRYQNQEEWDDIILDFEGHPLQLWGWGEVKSRHNWSAERVVFTDDSDKVVGAAQILSRKLPRPFKRYSYVPRGPVFLKGREGEVLEALSKYCKKHLSGVALTIEPDSTEMMIPKKWLKSPNPILMSDTIILDLTKDMTEIEAGMSKKTRQYIRKSSKEELVIKRVKTEPDIEKCLAIYKQTAERAKFNLHADDYYLDVAHDLADSSVIFASFDGDNPVAFLWLAISGKTAFELYGGMSDEGQRLRANYALKMHAIKKCKEWGIDRYDLNGLLDGGVSNFKQGFSSQTTELVGSFDLPLNPLYKVWTKGLPTIKRAVRAVKR